MDRFPDLVERLTIRLTGRGWHLPAYWSLTLGMFPLSSYIYKRRGMGKKKIVFSFLALILILTGILLSFFLRLFLIYIVLIILGRILGTLYRLIGAYEAYERPKGISGTLPLMYHSIQYIFIRLYGPFFKLPFIMATCGLGPVVLWCWHRGRYWKAISWLAAIFGLLLLVYMGYALALAFLILGALLFFIVYIVKRVGGEETIVHESPESEKHWDWAGVVFLAIVFLSFLINMKKFSPNVIDLWYHLAISRKILELGTIPVWDFWEFAPTGRPHLYPPLFHLIVAFLSRSPENVIQGGKYLQAFTYPLTLITTWFLARKFFGSKIAALSIFFLSMDMGIMLISTMALPSSFVTMFLPLLIFCFVRKKVIFSIIIMTAMLYSHLSFPFVVLFTLLLISLKYREYLKQFTIISSASLAIYLPWLARVLIYKGAFSSTTDHFLSIKGVFIGLLSLQIVNPILLILGIVAFIKMDDTRIENKTIKMVILGTLPILLFYGGRYWLHVVPFWAICIAIYLRNNFTTKKGIALLIIAMLVPSVSLVTTHWPPIMINLTGSDAVFFMWANDDGIVLDKQYDTDCDELARYLEENLPPDAIVSSDIEWVPNMVVTLTTLRTNQGAWWEVSSENDFTIPDAYITYYEMDGSTKIGRFFVTTEKDVILSNILQMDLWEAVITGSNEIIGLHLMAGANVDAREPANGSSPLIVAAAYGRESTVEYLLENGADIDFQNYDGNTALYLAAFLGRVEIVKLLIENGADRSIANNIGETPLKVVKSEWNEDLEELYEWLEDTYKFGLDLQDIYKSRPVIIEFLEE